MSKFIRKNKNNWFWVLVFMLILSLFSWWQTSSLTKAKYIDICNYNFGPGKSFEECMSFFYVQAGYFMKVLIGSITIGIISFALAIISLRDQKV